MLPMQASFQTQPSLLAGPQFIPVNGTSMPMHGPPGGVRSIVMVDTSKPPPSLHSLAGASAGNGSGMLLI